MAERANLQRTDDLSIVTLREVADELDSVGFLVFAEEIIVLRRNRQVLSPHLHQTVEIRLKGGDERTKN